MPSLDHQGVLSFFRGVQWKPTNGDDDTVQYGDKALVKGSTQLD